MTRKRERIIIIHDILKAIQDKKGIAKPTHILYKSNLSSQMLKEYMTDLIEKEFIKEDTDNKENKIYSLTNKGYKYIEDFSIIQRFMESYDLNDN